MADHILEARVWLAKARPEVFGGSGLARDEPELDALGGRSGPVAKLLFGLPVPNGVVDVGHAGDRFEDRLDRLNVVCAGHG